MANLTVSIAVMVLGVPGFALLAFATLWVALMSDGCYGNCDIDLMTVDWLMALAAPPAIFIAAIVWTIVRLARQNTAWWIPLAGAGLAVTIWLIGVAMMYASLGS